MRVIKDEQDSLAIAKPHNIMTPKDGYGYDDELPEAHKLHLARQTIIALGQVIRNFSANLQGPRKVEVLKQTYLLGLRSLGRVMQIYSGLIASLSELKDTGDSRFSLANLRTVLDQTLTALAQMYAVVVFQEVSSNIGVMNMEMAYAVVVPQLESTVALRLIDITVQMNHFTTFPEKEIRKLHDEIRTRNPFALGILQWLVASYLSLNKVDPRTLRGMAEVFNLDTRKLEASSPGS